MFLREHLLESCFDRELLIDGGAFAVPRFDPRLFLAAAALAGAAPQEILYVTNDPPAAAGARATGMMVTSIALERATISQFAAALASRSAVDPDASPTFMLRGRLVTMNDTGDVIEGARLAVARGTIVAVLRPGESPPQEFESAPIIDTAGTIYPGLIDLHNHFAYNVHALWNVPARFNNRTHWPRHREYREGINLATEIMAKTADVAKAMARYVEVKALVGGTTTGRGIRMKVQGFVGLARGLMRNIEITEDARLPEAATRVPDLNVNNAEQMAQFRRALEGNRVFLYHLSEGTDADARERFLELREHDLLKPALVGIHSLGLLDTDLKY